MTGLFLSMQTNENNSSFKIIQRAYSIQENVIVKYWPKDYMFLGGMLFVELLFNILV